ncbi:ABC transporter substrate-binding protein [Bisbaumannia pacifica]|uniref:ABC transporter substrate-binding protein n=1 Tax=Bisbaumannia pacifica TaxID=77098 RepID=A0ABD4KYN5_9GAMM|nr:ABC transporter substrate-binding protein [Halomonas pacifica]MBH8579491.1 ABC transporter substrate-binding protein [Halomonas pacifica]
MLRVRHLARLAALTLLLATPFAAPLAQADGGPPRLASLDWTLAETLVALGHPPIALGQVAAYHAWVGEPALPDAVIDLGLRSQPNLERLAALAPERILISPMFANLRPRLERIAPVSELTLYAPGEATWPQLLALTRELAARVEDPAAGEALIDASEARLAELRERLPETGEPLLIVQFMDARHVRVFGANGLFQAVLDRLGLENAWTRPTNAWGFSLASLEELAALEARLVVVEPYPRGVEARLADSGLWQHQPSVAADRVITLAPVWSFGALLSAVRFAELLVSALEAQP